MQSTVTPHMATGPTFTFPVPDERRPCDGSVYGQGACPQCTSMLLSRPGTPELLSPSAADVSKSRNGIAGPIESLPSLALGEDARGGWEFMYGMELD